MIVDFADDTTEDIYNGVDSRHARKIPPILWKLASRKLDLIDSATQLNDLVFPPGNRLEALRGKRKGFHSIRINDQYRIVFKWHENNASDVRIVDYH